MKLLPYIVKELLHDARTLSIAMHHDVISIDVFTLCLIRRVIKDPKFKALELNLSSAASEISKQKSVFKEIHRNPKVSLELQREIVKTIDQQNVSAYSILLSIISDSTSNISVMLSNYGVTYESLSALYNAEEHQAHVEFMLPPELENFCVDLSNEALNGGLDPLAGREHELTALIEVLSKRKKNSPLLIGEAGVGKSAIVEGLAQNILNKTAPKALHDIKIISVDLSAMISGTKYRGEFEERINTLLRYALSSQNVVLFIDEIHNIVGAGSAEGSMDAANILKPYLARGKIRCIGATTKAEFERYIAHDKALTRRFTPIEVLEPSFEETSSILMQIKNRYEEFHNVQYMDDLILNVPQLVKQHMPTKALPDSAIDLLDTLGSKISVANRNDRQVTIADAQELLEA